MGSREITLTQSGEWGKAPSLPPSPSLPRLSLPPSSLQSLGASTRKMENPISVSDKPQQTVFLIRIWFPICVMDSLRIWHFRIWQSAYFLYTYLTLFVFDIFVSELSPWLQTKVCRLVCSLFYKDKHKTWSFPLGCLALKYIHSWLVSYKEYIFLKWWRKNLLLTGRLSQSIFSWCSKTSTRKKDMQM